MNAWIPGCLSGCFSRCLPGSLWSHEDTEQDIEQHTKARPRSADSAHSVLPTRRFWLSAPIASRSATFTHPKCHRVSDDFGKAMRYRARHTARRLMRPNRLSRRNHYPCGWCSRAIEWPLGRGAKSDFPSRRLHAIRDGRCSEHFLALPRRSWFETDVAPI